MSDHPFATTWTFLLIGLLVLNVVTFFWVGSWVSVAVLPILALAIATQAVHYR